MRQIANNNEEQGLRTAVSGSFHRHMAAITTAVQELTSSSVRVLSPADPRVVAQHGEFLFVASDRLRSVRLVQDRHLESIRAADFLWLVCPDGYVGPSASMEVGFAAAEGIPIFSTQAPCDLTLREYVTVVTTVLEALRKVAATRRPKSREGLLIDPHASVEEAHKILDQINDTLMNGSGPAETEPCVYRQLARLKEKIAVRTQVQ